VSDKKIRRRGVRALSVGAGVGALALLITSCGGGADPAASAADDGASIDTAPVVTRWWASASGEVGSTSQGGTSVVRGAPDLKVYCASLQQTETRSTQTPLDAASDPSAVPAVLLWATETAAMAPADIADAWSPLVDMLASLSGARQGVAGGAVDASAVQLGTERIREHALSACGLTLTFL
jgi:hypothetical protein